MSIPDIIDHVSEKGNLMISGSLMSATAAICLEVLNRTVAVPYNWDVISLYFTPQDNNYEQKERYDRMDASTFLSNWLEVKGPVSSVAMARALQGLEYIIEISNVGADTRIHDLERDLTTEYQRVGSPIEWNFT